LPFIGFLGADRRCSALAMSACLCRIALSADELEWCIGPPLLGSFEGLLADTSPDLAWKAVRFYRERDTAHGSFESYPYSGVPEMLAAFGSVEELGGTGGVRPLVLSNSFRVSFGS
jgi:hypothetical protein